MARNPTNQKLYSTKDIPFFIIFVLIFLFLFKEFFFTETTIFDRDTALWEIPTRLLCSQLLKEGNFALWTDAYGNGQPFLANPKNAVLYPSTILYLFLPFFLAFKSYYLIHVVVGWLGIYYLGKSYSLSSKASFLGASLFVFSGIYLSSMEFYNHIATLAWMPWILFLLKTSLKRFIPRLVILAILWSLSILSGTPEIVLITLILGLLQSLFSSQQKKIKISLTLFSFFLSILITSAQLLPSLELWKQSNRKTAQNPEWPLEMVQLLNLPFPNILGNDREPGHNDYWAGYLFDREYPLYYSFYIGFGALILFFFAFKKPLGKTQIFLAITFGLFLLLASGKYSPLYFISKMIPFLSSIRYPVKFIAGSMFSFSMLASIGFDNVFTSNRVKRNGICFLFSLSCLSILLFSIFQQRIIKFFSNSFFITLGQSLKDLKYSFWYGLVIFVLCAAILLLFTLQKRKWPLFSFILIALIIIDLTYCNKFINPVISALFFKKPIFLENVKTPIRVYREAYFPKNLKKEGRNIKKASTYYRQSLYPFCGIGDGVIYLFNEDRLRIYPPDYQMLFKLIQKCQGEDLLKILRAHGCDYYIGHGALPNLPYQTENIEDFAVNFQEVRETADPVYVVYNSVKANSLEDKLRKLLDKNFSPSKSAIVEKDFLLKQPAFNSDHDTIVSSESTQGRKRAFVSISQPAMVVFQGNYDSGWKAWIDGKFTDVFKVNLASKGILVPSGKHEIELRYLPRSFVLGIIISIFFLITLGGLILYEFLNKKRTKNA
jgi:hypothetical protein